MTITVIKWGFRKFQPWLINYSSYKNFSNEAFRVCSLEKSSRKLFVNNADRLKTFCDINLQVPNQHAAQKINYVRGNQLLFMTKQFSKETSKFDWTLDNIRIENIISTLILAY